MPDRGNDQRPTQSYLHALLGLRADATVAQLRWAYQQAVAAATRSGDTERALALSDAYDTLPAEIRHQVSEPAADPVSYPRPVLVRPPAPARPQPPRRRSATSRILWCLIALPVAVIAGIAYQSHYSHQPARDRPPPSVNVPQDGGQPGPAPPRSAAPGLPPQHQTVNQRLVPLDAPTDGDGFVAVICSAVASQLGYTQYVRPGTTVSCTNGAVPHFVRR